MTTAALIALATLAAAAAAFSRRRLIHAVLLLVGSWAGVAAFYLWAGAEFAAFAQLLVYVGAISMVALFAVLLTRRGFAEEPAPAARFSYVLAAAAVFGVLAAAVLASDFPAPPRAAPPAGLAELGRDLGGPLAPVLLVVGLILTVALIGGVLLAAGPGRAEGGDGR